MTILIELIIIYLGRVPNRPVQSHLFGLVRMDRILWSGCLTWTGREALFQSSERSCSLNGLICS